MSEQIARCEFCDRGNYLSRDNTTCSGCGAPLSIPEPLEPMVTHPITESLQLLRNAQLMYQSPPPRASFWYSLMEGAGSAGVAMLTPLIGHRR